MNRICKRCFVEKNISEFYLQRKDDESKGRQHVCKDCRIKQNYPDYNPNVTENNKRYYFNNSIKIRKKVYAYRQTTMFKKKILRYRAAINNSSCRTRGIKGEASAFDLWCILKKQKMICPFTGIRLDRKNFSIDHIIPVSRGGENAKNNIRIVHKMANRMRWNANDLIFIDMCKLIVANQTVI